MTKVFWSWQSDRPGKTGRHFVREALEEAIKAILSDANLEEPQRDLHLDHDRKGVPGSPDLANAILEKIRASAIFVADVTNIGTCDEKDDEGNHKRIMNPNVAIELGYALDKVGSAGILMVMNEAYGGRKTLPFDLSHKAGPVLYKLAADASKTEIQEEKRKLVSILKTALRECMAVVNKVPPTPVFQGMPAIEDRPSSFIKGGEVLCRPKSHFGDALPDIFWTDGSQFFLRVIPHSPLTSLKLAQLKQDVDAGGLKPFPNHQYKFSEINKWGVVVLNDKRGDPQTTADLITQVTTQGEMWGIDGFSLRDRQVLPVEWESYFVQALHQYLTFYVNYLRLGAPLTLIGGMTGVEGYEILPPQQPGTMSMRQFGFGVRTQVPVAEIVWKEEVTVIENKPLKMLLPFFEKVWDTCGEHRPHWLPKE